ncbi:MAG: ImuA family protein [Kiloniellaceae bacterium]
MSSDARLPGQDLRRFPGLSDLPEPPGAARAPASGPPSGAAAGLAALRAQVRRLEQGTGLGDARALAPRPVVPLGLAALDAALPGGGLPLGALHEIEGERAEWDDGATLGFCLALLARLERAFPDSGQILWVSRRGDLYPPALAGQGLAPGRFLIARARSDAEVLWAMEEGLRCVRLAAVVGEVEGLDRLAGRRLQLAAEASRNETSGVTAFALHRRFRPPRAGRAASAALSRWRVTPRASGAPSQDLWGESFIGRPRWRLDLLRCRGAAPGSWQVEWDDAACGFSLAAALRDRSLGACPGRAAAAGPAPGPAAGFRRAG